MGPNIRGLWREETRKGRGDPRGRKTAGQQLLSEHAGTPLWLWTKCRNENREECMAEWGAGNMLIFLRKCKLGSITAEETEKKKNNKNYSPVEKRKQ